MMSFFKCNPEGTGEGKLNVYAAQWLGSALPKSSTAVQFSRALDVSLWQPLSEVSEGQRVLGWMCITDGTLWSERSPLLQVPDKSEKWNGFSKTGLLQHFGAIRWKSNCVSCSGGSRWGSGQLNRLGDDGVIWEQGVISWKSPRESRPMDGNCHKL